MSRRARYASRVSRVQRPRHLVAQRRGHAHVLRKRGRVVLGQSDLGQQNVRFAGELLVSALARGDHRAKSGVSNRPARGASDHRLQQGELGAGEGRGLELCRAFDFDFGAAHDAVLQRDACGQAVTLAELVAVTRLSSRAQRGAQLALGLQRARPGQVCPCRCQRELAKARRGSARSERLPAETQHLIGLFDEAEAQPELDQIRDVARETETVAQAPAHGDRPFRELERLGVVVAFNRQYREIGQREADRPSLAAGFCAFEHLEQHRARLVRAAAREQRDRAVHPRAQLR